MSFPQKFQASWLHSSTNSTPASVMERLPRRLQAVAARGVKVEIITREQLFMGKYLTDQLVMDAAAKLGTKLTGLNGGLGIGKSVMSGNLKRNYFSNTGVAATHRVGLVGDLCKPSKFGATNYETLKSKLEQEETVSVGTTIHSLAIIASIPAAKPAFRGGLLMLDESESCASEFANGGVKNEAEAIKAIGDAIKASSLTIFADAHLSEMSLELALAAGVDINDIGLIYVDFPEMEGCTSRIIEDATKDAIIRHVIKQVKAGKKVTVPSLSADFCNDLAREAVKSGIHDLKVIVITSSTDKATRESIGDNYQSALLVTFSPSISTGTSFDGDKDDCNPDGTPYIHADETIVVAINNNNTGTPQDALQASMRDRRVKSKLITVFVLNADNLQTHEAAVRDYNYKVEAAFDELERLGILQQYGMVRPDQGAVNRFLSNVKGANCDAKLRFTEILVEEFTQKGATVVMGSFADVCDEGVTKEEIKAHKMEAYEEAVEASSVSALPPEDADKHDPELKAAFDRKYVEDNMMVSFDDLTVEERKQAIRDVIVPTDFDKSLLSYVRRLERAYADDKLLDKLIEVALVGVQAADDDRVSHLSSSFTDRVHWHTDKRITALAMKAAGYIHTEEGLLERTADVTLTASAIRNPSHPAHALFQSLTQNTRPAVIAGIVKGSENIVKANPVKHVVEILKGIGFKVAKTRGVDEWTVCDGDMGKIVGAFNRRKAAGLNQLQDWLDGIMAYKDGYAKRVAADNSRADKLKRLPRTELVKALEEALATLGREDLISRAADHFKQFEERMKSGSYSHIAIHAMVSRWVKGLRDDAEFVVFDVTKYGKEI